jgi:alpha-ketoglutarate-dependent taurine dioxygenase
MTPTESMNVASQSTPMGVDIAALKTKGWLLGTLDASTETSLCNGLLSLASMLGAPVVPHKGVPSVSQLRPKQTKYARHKSLSAQFSVGAFPLHTDTAHWPVPCRYLLLACLTPGIGERETFVLDSATLGMPAQQRELLYTVPFRVLNGRLSFFSTVLQHGRPFIRYDPGCMSPVFPNGERVREILDNGTRPAQMTSIRWTPGQVLVIDNWRILHGRGEAACDDGQRTLLRLYVNGA